MGKLGPALLKEVHADNQPTNQPTNQRSEGGDLREAQVDVPRSI